MNQLYATVCIRVLDNRNFELCLRVEPIFAIASSASKMSLKVVKSDPKIIDLLRLHMFGLDP